jgi:hypothetical protein
MIPRLKVKTRMIFWRIGKRIPVRTGIGMANMAKSVMMLTGAAQMNSVSKGMHRVVPE